MFSNHVLRDLGIVPLDTNLALLLPRQITACLFGSHAEKFMREAREQQDHNMTVRMRMSD